MTRSASSVWIRLVALAGIGTAILFGSACDGGGSKRDSLYKKLVGAWRINKVLLSGGTERVDDDAIRVEFLERDDTRSYRIIRTASNDTTGRGRLDVPRSNVLRMTSGLNGPLTWNFEFDGSQRVRFELRRADDESVRTFLTAIGLSGGTESLAVDLRRDE